MNSKTLIAIAAVALGLLAAAMWVTTKSEQTVTPASTGAAKPESLFPGLIDKANDVAKVVIETGETKVTLVKGEDSWGLEESHNYPVTFNTLRDLIRNVGDMQISEKKTANPEFFERLEVQDTGAGSTSKAITLHDASGAEVASLIVGKAEYGASEKPQQFVRRKGENQVWLVSGNVTPMTTPDQWLDKEVVNVPASDPRHVAISHTDGESVVASRANSSQTSFDLSSLPEGRELKNTTVTNEFSRILSGVRFDKVEPREARTLSAEDRTTSVTVELFDGVSVTANIHEIEGVKYAAFSAATNSGYIEAENARRRAEHAEQKAALAEGEPEPAEPTLVDAEAATKRVNEINKRTEKWVYTLPSFVNDRLSRRNEFYLAELKTEEPAAVESTGEPSETSTNLEGVPLPDGVREMLEQQIKEQEAAQPEQ